MAPLWPDPVSLAALQARALIDAGKATEADFAAVAARSRRDALANPKAQVANDTAVETLLEDEYVVAPLRRHALPPITDGAAAIVLAAGDRARQWSERPAWITGFDHRIETHSLGARDLTASPSTATAEPARWPAWPAGRSTWPRSTRPSPTRSSSSREALGLDDSVDDQPLGRRAGRQPDHVGRAHPHRRGGRPHLAPATASRAVAHATSGPCLQQNLVCVLEGE